MGLSQRVSSITSRIATPPKMSDPYAKVYTMKKSRMTADQKKFYRITLALIKDGVELPPEIKTRWLMLQLNCTY